jgi:2',3'-cyclic-nucleotide 2'-phosphodiesterase (5'-nucleotidase family)
VLLLDAGNALWSQRPLTQQTEGKVIIEAMNLMGYDAMAVGDLDLLLGPDVLRQRIADAQFPILSANVLVAGEQQLLAEPYTIVTLGDHKVGIIGLTWDEASLPSDEFQLLKAEDVLAQYVPQLAGQADMIIVLSTMGFEEDQQLSTLMPSIDLIVGGRNRLPLPESWQNQDSGTVVTQAGAQGEWIGRRVLHLNSVGEVTGYADELLLLTEDYPDDPEMRAFLDSYSVQ